MTQKKITVTHTFFFSLPLRMSIAFAQFLKASKHKSNALTKFIEVASYNEVTTSIGWSSRLEAAKLILNEGQGKARSKAKVFQWLNEMTSFNGKNLFVPLILLGKYSNTPYLFFFFSHAQNIGKCHENEICKGCDKELTPSYYELGLKCKIVDASLEVFARMKLVELYYKSSNPKLIEQLSIVEPLVKSLPDSTDTEVKKNK
jgi:hypothetical protein